MINTDSKKELQMMVAEQKNRRNLGRYFITNPESSTDRTTSGAHRAIQDSF